ncbi:MAG: transcription antitermination factor NusB [Gammaproteobacteria bacterium]|jgi:N utilization substance protein B|nr:transcription antitermination factor NusB [Gammaproteobacteria bacterium]|tara:strand:- start:2129 stop:2578 length:450 start_codon:yes stop_codon:yes gene_type:complete
MSENAEKNEEARLTKKGRSGSRQLLLQALYQYQLNGDDFDILISQSKRTKEFKRIDQTHFKTLLQEVLKNTDKLDKISSKHSERSGNQIDPIERAIIWISLIELLSHKDTPANVVINEAIELAKIFGGQDSYQFINGVLDAFLKEHSSK